jgi:hypothetical protein
MDKDDSRAADTVTAAVLRAGQVEIVAEKTALFGSKTKQVVRPATCQVLTLRQ